MELGNWNIIKIAKFYEFPRQRKRTLAMKVAISVGRPYPVEQIEILDN